jgi:hypothetical protein
MPGFRIRYSGLTSTSPTFAYHPREFFRIHREATAREGQLRERTHSVGEEGLEKCLSGGVASAEGNTVRDAGVALLCIPPRICRRLTRAGKGEGSMPSICEACGSRALGWPQCGARGVLGGAQARVFPLSRYLTSKPIILGNYYRLFLFFRSNARRC